MVIRWEAIVSCCGMPVKTDPEQRKAPAICRACGTNGKKVPRITLEHIWLKLPDHIVSLPVVRDSLLRRPGTLVSTAVTSGATSLSGPFYNLLKIDGPE